MAMIDERKIDKIKKSKPFSLADIIIMSAVLIAAILLIVFLVHGREGDYLCVTFGGEDTYYSLSTDQVINLNDIITIEIKNGYASVTHSTCENHDCELIGGKIKYVGQKIVCLPNKIVLKITSSNAPDPGWVTT